MLAVPERAVIDTGSRKFVYREAEPDVYDGVEVQLGPRCGDFYPVIRGLAGRRPGGDRGLVPHRRRDAADGRRRLDLLRRQRRAQGGSALRHHVRPALDDPR